MAAPLVLESYASICYIDMHQSRSNNAKARHSLVGASRNLSNDSGSSFRSLIQDVEDYLAFLVQMADRIKIHYLWRPYLKDAKDDMVLEVAVTAGVKYIVTHNINDFSGVELFGIKAVTPGWLLKNIGGTQ